MGSGRMMMIHWESATQNYQNWNCFQMGLGRMMMIHGVGDPELPELELLPDELGANDDDPLGVGDPELPNWNCFRRARANDDDPLGLGDPELPELELLPDGPGANDDPLGVGDQITKWNCFQMGLGAIHLESATQNYQNWNCFRGNR